MMKVTTTDVSGCIHVHCTSLSHAHVIAAVGILSTACSLYAHISVGSCYTFISRLAIGRFVSPLFLIHVHVAYRLVVLFIHGCT